MRKQRLSFPGNAGILHPYNILNISIYTLFYTLFYGNYPNALKAIYEGEINTHI